jgi:hypothetical protein
MRRGFRRRRHDNAPVGLLALEQRPRRIHVRRAAAAQLCRVKQRVHGKQVGGVVIDDVPLHLRAVPLLRLPVVGPRRGLVELVLVVEERVELQRVNDGDGRQRLARFLPRELEIRGTSLSVIFSSNPSLAPRITSGGLSAAATSKPGALSTRGSWRSPATTCRSRRARP